MPALSNHITVGKWNYSEGAIFHQRTINELKTLVLLRFSPIRQIHRTDQNVLSKGWEAPQWLPSVCEDVILQEETLLQAGGHSNIPTQDIDSIVVESASQVQAGFGRVLIEVEPLFGGNVVGLHGEHVLAGAGSLVWSEVEDAAPHQVDGLLHRQHLLLADVHVAQLQVGPGIRSGTVLQDAHVPSWNREEIFTNK